MQIRPPPAPMAPPTPDTQQHVLMKLLRHGAIPQLRKVIEKTLPADISPVLPLLHKDEQKQLLQLLIEGGKAGRVLLELDRDQVAEILAELDVATIAAICSSSASDDAADLLELLDQERRQEVLAQLESSTGADLASLLAREPETAGSLMTTNYLALDQKLTVASAIEAIRQYPRKDSFFYVYIIDAEEHLVGVLSLRSLILADPSELLENVMVQNVVRVSIDVSQEEVAQLVAKYDLLSLPVVNAQNQLLGVVTVDDVLDVIQEEAEEDMLHLGGVTVGERITSSPLASFRLRFPWLAVNLVTAFIAASVVRAFEGTIARWAVLAAFMPVVAGMGGNAGTQTLTVMVRGLAFGELDWKSSMWPLGKELVVGLANGLANGILTGLVVGLWTQDWRLAAVLCLAMMFNMVVAGVSGAFVPLTLKRLGFDPAVSSGIFVTTFTDVAGFSAFLGLATLALRLWEN
jgi:magnesium transporter